jgi:hypothetical protein
MIILAHRGVWQNPAEKNSAVALRRALENGFGVETDIRDLDGQLVISHDPPRAGAMPLADFLDAYVETQAAGMLALNIKADGLQQTLAHALASRQIGPDRYFVFDMAVPDALGYLRLEMPCFTRQSEVEPEPAFIDQASGIWLDCFREDWIHRPDIMAHCAAGRRVAVVSPELHGRDWRAAWEEWREAYRDLGQRGLSKRFMICTDYPLEAKAYFDAPD